MKFIGIGLVVMLAWMGRAQDFFSVGARGGASFNGNLHRFKQVEAFTEINLPWDWNFCSDWRLQSLVDGSVGAMNGEDTMAFVGTAGPTLVLSRQHFPIVAEIGFSPTVLSCHQFGNKDFGDDFQFTSHVGVAWNLTQHFRLGYRLQHMSNGGIASPNPGLNEQMVSFSYRF